MEGERSAQENEPKNPNEGVSKERNARKRVKTAQLKVLDELDEILEGNCKRAKSGDYRCAEFMLDWAGVTDLRTPLARTPKRQTSAAKLLKQLRKPADQPKKGAESAKTK